jgi:hypothetical protein
MECRFAVVETGGEYWVIDLWEIYIGPDGWVEPVEYKVFTDLMVAITAAQMTH